MDEVLAVGDADFQQKCAGKITDVASEGRTILFVSHNLSLISQITDTALFLDSGRLAAFGPTEAVIHAYRNGPGARSSGAGEYVVTDDDRWNPAGLSREVVITRLNVLDAPRLESGSDLRVRIRLQAQVSVPAFRAHLGVLTIDGQGVCAAFSDEAIGLEAGQTKRRRAAHARSPPGPRLVPAGDLGGSRRSLRFPRALRCDHPGGALRRRGAPVRDDGTPALGWNLGWGHGARSPSSSSSWTRSPSRP